MSPTFKHLCMLGYEPTDSDGSGKEFLIQLKCKLASRAVTNLQQYHIELSSITTFF